MTPAGSGSIIGPRDIAVIRGQLGRRPRDLTGVAVRCLFGYPAVIETAPVLTGGAPNPTLLYLTCPTMVTAVSRAEADGGVRRLKSLSKTDPELRRFLDTVTVLYRRRRTELASSGAEALSRVARLEAGIGGPAGPEVASCLHAYAAALLAVMTGWLQETQPTGVMESDESFAAGLQTSTSHMVAEGDADEADEAGARLIDSAGDAWTRFLPPVSECWCTDRRCRRWASGERRAAIDMGTISTRLLVADMVDGRPQTVVRRAVVTRLGRGLVRGTALASESRRKTADTVACFVQEARTFGCDSLILAGTSATRDAVDGEEYVLELGRKHDIQAVVLSGRREAELTYAGASLDFPGEAVVLVDIGGGSTEFTVRPQEGRLECVSLELGASRASDRWLISDPPTPAQIARLREETDRVLAGLDSAYRAVISAGSYEGGYPLRRLVGVAGTVTTLACLDMGLQEYDSRLIHLRGLSLDSVRALVARLSGLTTAERAALPCVQPGRAPVIVGGAIIVLVAMEALGYETLTVSERDLLDGLVLFGAEEPV